MTVTDVDPQHTAGPYATAAATYRRAGWSPLPLPHGQKKSPPNGWTGRDGAWPNGADVQAWTEDHGDGNVALRMPPNVLGIDVDDYKDKPGAAVLDTYEQQHGTLPATWVSSSRGGRSGIRFYRIPEGLRWPGVLGPGIETIRFDHRYAVAWPSLHPEGGTYRWTRPDGAIALDELPNVDDLPALPDAWVVALTRGELATDQPRADLTDTAAGAWLRERSTTAPCRVMEKVLDRGVADFGGGASRHDAALGLTNRIAWLAGEGHQGGVPALLDARAAFLKAMAGDRDDLDGEWDRMVSGAIRLSAAAHPQLLPDPCDDPFAGLIPKENPWTASSSPSMTPQRQDSSKTVPAQPAGGPGESPGSLLASASPGSPGLATPVDGTSISETAPERTSWWPRDTDLALDPDAAEPGPAYLTRDDGQALFYAGRVNGLIAPSESGKTWLALEAVRQVVAAGEHATILDFEDTHRGVTDRLLALNLTATQIREHVAYIGPDEPLRLAFDSGRDLYEHLTTWQPSIIVLDGFNAAMSVHGYDLNSNKDATDFARVVLKPLTATGAAVVYVDHTVKDKDSTSAGGIGAQAKRAMTTGCAIRVDVKKQFGKGQNGTLTLRVDKDRQGDVRGASLPSSDGGHWAGTAQLTSHDDGTVTITVESPGTRMEARAAFRPTLYMDRVSQYIADNPGQGRNVILGCVQGDDKKVKEALALLVADGWVRVEEDGQKHRHYSVAPFSDLISPPSATGGGTGGGLGVAPPVNNRGWVGVTGQDVVLPPTPPVQVPADPPRVNSTPTPGSHLVKRAIAGREVMVDLSTGEVHG